MSDTDDVWKDWLNPGEAEDTEETVDKIEVYVDDSDWENANLPDGDLPRHHPYSRYQLRKRRNR